MKTNVLKKLLSVVLLIAMMLDVLAVVPFAAFAEDLKASGILSSEKKEESSSESGSHAYEPFQSIKEHQYSEHADQVDESTILLKLPEDAPALSPVPEELAGLGVVLLRTVVDVTTPEAMESVGAQEPYRWVVAGLKDDVKATDIALSFAEVPYVLDAEYNYIRQTTAFPDAETNPLVEKQWYLDDPILKSWEYLDTNGWRENLKNIVVAVIDTGVDYEHTNLRDSMWVNSGEIPGDGVDNDANGYTDDVHGVSTIGSIYDSNGDPMDNMGHGTHVAGIIAAAPDQMGMVGVAHGVQIMAIKAGDGFFNDSDIVEGINYAVQMGADVINMSFGSYTRAAMMEDALAIAYSSAVLVAAAGNDGGDIDTIGPCYPAAYNFVIGVMAEDETGNVANFSNTDGIRRNSMEYEVSAPGSRIFSTLPDDRYASWSGTSMASPYVAGVAALLRAKYSDKSEYSTRFIMGQIVGTAEMARMGLYGIYPISVNAYQALTVIPEPDVSYYDYYIFDDVAYSEKNNGDGIIDAGETIGLGVLIRNHWGQARKTKVQLIAAMNSEDASLNPHVTWITDTVEYGDIGTFMTASNGFSYNSEGVITGISDPFMFTVAENTPNDAYLTFSVVIDCESYTEGEETESYHFEGDSFTAQVRHGVELPRKIVQDMTLKADTYYIISGSTLIDQGVTVTVEPGTQIQFWGDYSKELYAGTDVAQLIVDGELIVKGTENDPVEIFTSGSMYGMEVKIVNRNKGKSTLEYCNLANPNLQVTTIDHCYFTQMIFDAMYTMMKDMDGRWYPSYVTPNVSARTVTNTIFYELGYRFMYYDYRLYVSGKLQGNLFDSCGLNFSDWSVESYKDNVFLKNYRLVESQINDRTYLTSEFSISSKYNRSNRLYPMSPVKNPETGSTYFVLRTSSLVLAEQFAQTLGGHVVRIGDERELDFLLEYTKRYCIENEEELEGNSINHLYVGFYRGEAGLTYIGEGKDEDWLKIGEGISIPVIYPSYSTNPDGSVAERSAYLSTVHVWDYDYNELTQTSPSAAECSYRGVIIEIPGDISPVSVTLDADALTLPSNTANYQLQASVYPNVEDAKLHWSSNNEEVITVDEAGKITAKGLGVATVTATIDGTSLSDEIVIVVVQYYEPTGFTDDESELKFNKYQQTHQLTHTVTPDEASPLIDYVSSDTSVVMVSSTGMLTAVGSGSATVTASIRGTELKLEYAVTVTIPPSAITPAADYVILAMDDTTETKLSYTYGPDYSTVGAPQFITSDSNVVTVDGDGTLHPMAPGDAVVLIYFPDVEMSVRVRVHVAAKRESVKIVSASPLGPNTSMPLLYAEDGTAYLFYNENVVGDAKFPQRLPLKVWKATMRWAYEWAVIDTDHRLYIGNLNNYHMIEEDVADVALNTNSEDFFYQKLDGTVWFYDYSEETSYLNDSLENIVSMVGTNRHYLFLDKDGAIWTASVPGSSDNMNFNVQLMSVDGTVAKLDSRFCYTEEGSVYRFTWSEDGVYLTQAENVSAQKLEAVLGVSWSEVVDVAFDEAPNRYWLLLKDGRVVFSGAYGTTSFDKNISTLVDCPANGVWSYSFVQLPQKVVDLGNGAFVLEDGTAWMIGSTWGAILGNGKSYDGYNCNLTAPVLPWIGAKNDGKKIEVLQISFDTADGTVTLPYTSEHLDVKVPVNASIRLKLSKTVAKNQLANTKLYFRDDLGNKIAASASLDALGQTLIITADEPFREGYGYTLSIGGILTDDFGNNNVTVSLSFSAEGVAVYEIPVTDLQGGEELTLVYAQGQQLQVQILPENATMKKVYWNTSDASVVTVTSNGYVVGRKNGTATVTATAADGGKQVTFTVTVSTPPEDAFLESEFFYLEKGQTGRSLALSVYPAYADLGTLTYRTMDESVVTVDENGVLTAVEIGKTTVGVTSSKTGKTYFATVQVVEDASSAQIQKVIGNSGDVSFTMFIAEDGTLWIINCGSSYSESNNTFIPQKLSVKVRDAVIVHTSLFYIAQDGALYKTAVGSPDAGTKICENVASIERYECVYPYYGLFVVKNDASVWFYNNVTETMHACSALSDIREVHYGTHSGQYYFLKKDGTVLSIANTEEYERFYSLVNHYVSVPFAEKIEAFILQAGLFVGESGNLYSVSHSDKEATSSKSSLSEWAAYRSICDRIVKITHAKKNDIWANTYLALLDDGTVAYVGSYSAAPQPLKNLLTETENNQVAQVIDMFSSVVDIAPGYIVCSDGSVYSYACGGSYPYGDLGNNNKLEKHYPLPVKAWFGAVDTGVEIRIQSAVAGVEGNLFAANGALHFEGLLPADATFTFTFSDIAYYCNAEGIYFEDAFGARIPVECTLDPTGKILTVIPKTTLSAGYEYSLILPSQTFADEFQNYNAKTVYTLTVEGTPVYDVPVTGIEPAGEASLTMQYGDVMGLTVNLLPADATMKHVTWATSDPNVVKVNEYGVITAYYNGTATVTATTKDGSFTATFTVTVSTKPQSVQLLNGYLSMEVGDGGKYLQLDCAPSYADLGTLSYVSLDSSVAAVDAQTGEIRAIGLGETMVGVTSSVTGQTYYAAVFVLPDASSVRIDYASGQKDGVRVFIAEDHTVWYIANQSVDGDNYYVPIKASFKAKAVSTSHRTNQIYYVSPDGTLYYRYGMESDSEYKVADNVVAIAYDGYQHMFYLTEDKKVFYQNNSGYSCEVSLLTGVVELECLGNGSFCFVSSNGDGYYLSYSMLDYNTTKISSDMVRRVRNEEKIKYILPFGNGMLGENGTIYTPQSDNTVAVNSFFREREDYQAIKDDIVKLTGASGVHSDAYLALMKDGSVVFMGSTSYMPVGLRNCLPQGTPGNEYVITKLQGIEAVADIAPGYLILEDGTLYAFQTGSSYHLLGNNNRAGDTYRAPVTAWIGAADDGTEMHATGVSAVFDDTTSKDLYTGGFVNDLEGDFRVEIVFDKYIYSADADFIAVSDVYGNLVPITLSYLGNALTVKLKESAQAGMIYRLKVPGGSLGDLYGNGSEHFEIRFGIAGEMTFDVPVESITDTVTEVTLQYQQEHFFHPTVAPETATVKDLFWHSDNPEVATVDQTGLVTAGKNGVASVKATTLDGKKTYEYTVRVKTPVESFTLSSDFVLLDMESKTTLQLSCELTPSILAGSTELFTWKSADTSIVEVDANGTITAKSAGVTAVYCKCEGSDELAVCVVSVLEDRSVAEIDRVFTSHNGGSRILAAGNNVWLIDSTHRVPYRVTVENAEKILPAPYPDFLLVVTTDGKLQYFSAQNGALTDIISEGVKDAICYSGHVMVLKNDGTLYSVSINGAQADVGLLIYSEPSLFELEGIQQISSHGYDNHFYILTNNGMVCKAYFGTTNDWSVFYSDKNDPITDIGIADGAMMKSEAGNYYPLYMYADMFEKATELLETHGFGKIKDQIADIAVLRNSFFFDSYNFGMLLLLNDGRLAYLGTNYQNCPLYGSYEFTRATNYDSLYYIGVEDVAIRDIGGGWILFADGSVKLFTERGEYLGNAIYTDGNQKPVSPYFMVTDLDVNQLDLEKILSGSTELSVETPVEITPPESFEIVFKNPVVSNDRLHLTTIQYRDDNGDLQYLDCKVSADCMKITVIPLEALMPGTDYTVTVYAGAIKDIFDHTNEKIEFTVLVKEPANEVLSTVFEENLYPTTEFSPDYTLKELQVAVREFYSEALLTYIERESTNVNNAFLNGFANPDATAWMELKAQYDSQGDAMASLIGNYWGTTKTELIDRIIYDMKDSFEYAELLYSPYLTEAPESAYPFVTSIIVKNSEGNIVSSVGLETITVQVSFNRDMDMSVQPTVSYGGDYPYGDFLVDGDWTDARTWVGTARITAVTGSGTQYFKVRGAVAANDSWLVTGNDYERFAFTISTSGAKSMSLQANSADGYVELEWTQDDFDTMAGYNIYRSNVMDEGSFIRINSSIIPAADGKNTFIDYNTEAGVEYFYYFTVVKTDFTESAPSAITSAAAHDITPPTISHSTVTSSAEQAGIPIVAYVYDNMNVIRSVTLYYRVKGQTEYSSMEMYAHSGEEAQNKYSANIPATAVTAAGVEYYLEASDGRQSGFFGTASNPYGISTYRLYTVSVAYADGGKISVSTVRAKAGEWIRVSATPNEGYAYLAGSLTYSYGDTTAVIENGAFRMPEADVTVSVSFMEKSGHEIGDVNMDGRVDSADAILLLRYDAGLQTLNDQQLLLADVDENGYINVQDARWILCLDAGL